MSIIHVFKIDGIDAAFIIDTSGDLWRIIPDPQMIWKLEKIASYILQGT